VFTQWLASIALVMVNAEMRFLWLALATAILVATVVVSHRQLQAEKALREVTPPVIAGGSTPPGNPHG
jgi:hypothetical protein